MTTSATQLEKAQAAKRKAKAVFAQLDQLSGIGLTRRSGRYVVKVLLSDEVSETDAHPAAIDGVPVVFQVIGKVRKQPTLAARKKVHRRQGTSRPSVKR